MTNFYNWLFKSSSDINSLYLKYIYNRILNDEKSTWYLDRVQWGAKYQRRKKKKLKTTLVQLLSNVTCNKKINLKKGLCK